jgi:SAM-dependent methyltransferase
VEVGCGTGHWLRELAESGRTLVGIDRSWRMLERARLAAPSALLLRGDAATLPLETSSIQRIFCVNVLHHVVDREAFVHECLRVLEPGGAFVTIGLDPHTESDRWWVYDYFPAARTADLQRYPSAATIRDLLTTAGFVDVTTEVAEHLSGAVPVPVARDRGSVDRRATSQLMVISDADFEAGLARLGIDQPVLRTDLQLFATAATAPHDAHPA